MDDLLIQHGLAAHCQRAKRQLLVPRNPELSGEKNIERRMQLLCYRERHRNAAPRNAKDEWEVGNGEDLQPLG